MIERLKELLSKATVDRQEVVRNMCEAWYCIPALISRIEKAEARVQELEQELQAAEFFIRIKEQ